MILGEVIQLPVTLQKLTNERSGRFKYNDVEIGFVRSLELYKVQFFFFALIYSGIVLLQTT